MLPAVLLSICGYFEAISRAQARVTHAACDIIKLELIYIKNQCDATWQYVISNCNNTLHVSDAICVHPQEHLKTVVTASGL